MVLAPLMMLAFLVDQTQQLCCALFQAVWAKLGSKGLLWERIRALFFDYSSRVDAEVARSSVLRLEEVLPSLCRRYLLIFHDPIDM